MATILSQSRSRAAQIHYAKCTAAVLGMAISSPISRLPTRLKSIRIEQAAAPPALAPLEKKLATVKIQEHPLIHQPGGDNPLGRYSPYLPPLQIEGIRRAPRPIEVDPIPGSENLLKIRPPKPDGPWGEYAHSLGAHHSWWDKYISSMTPMLYIFGFLALAGSFHDLTFQECCHILDRL